MRQAMLQAPFAQRGRLAQVEARVSTGTRAGLPQSQTQLARAPSLLQAACRTSLFCRPAFEGAHLCGSAPSWRAAAVHCSCIACSGSTVQCFHSASQRPARPSDTRPRPRPRPGLDQGPPLGVGILARGHCCHCWVPRPSQRPEGREWNVLLGWSIERSAERLVQPRDRRGPGPAQRASLGDSRHFTLDAEGEPRSVPAAQGLAAGGPGPGSGEGRHLPASLLGSPSLPENRVGCGQGAAGHFGPWGPRAAGSRSAGERAWKRRPTEPRAVPGRPEDSVAQEQGSEQAQGGWGSGTRTARTEEVRDGLGTS
nr:translation initiation factor IF-2 [Oryctolagus cuniculus]